MFENIMNLDELRKAYRADADKIDIFFCDCDAVYRGNIYKAGKIIGDYSTADSTRIETMFPQLKINWG